MIVVQSQEIIEDRVVLELDLGFFKIRRGMLLNAIGMNILLRVQPHLRLSSLFRFYPPIFIHVKAAPLP